MFSAMMYRYLQVKDAAEGWGLDSSLSSRCWYVSESRGARVEEEEGELTEERDRAVGAMTPPIFSSTQVTSDRSMRAWDRLRRPIDKER